MVFQQCATEPQRSEEWACKEARGNMAPGVAGILPILCIGLLINTCHEERALGSKKVGKTTDLAQFHQLGNNPSE